MAPGESEQKREREVDGRVQLSEKLVADLARLGADAGVKMPAKLRLESCYG